MRGVWLVTGASGQVGGALAEAPPEGVRVFAPTRAQLDLSASSFDLASVIAREQVTAIVNCGAYTQVDGAEDEPAVAMQVNGNAPRLLAEAARVAGLPLVQLSTDYVFSGDKVEAYREDDEPEPRSAYGQSKLAGEQAVEASGARHAILRTAWVFSSGGNNFVRTMLRLARERETVGVVADQLGCPTHAADLAQAVATVTLALQNGSAPSGIWHIVNAGETSWHGFAQRIFARAASHGLPTAALKAILSEDYATRALRPANSRLATEKALVDFGIRLRRWEEAVDAVVDEIIARERNGQA